MRTAMSSDENALPDRFLGIDQAHRKAKQENARGQEQVPHGFNSRG